jgi:hypothetical protein
MTKRLCCGILKTGSGGNLNLLELKNDFEEWLQKCRLEFEQLEHKYYVPMHSMERPWPLKKKPPKPVMIVDVKK